MYNFKASIFHAVNQYGEALALVNVHAVRRQGQNKASRGSLEGNLAPT